MPSAATTDGRTTNDRGLVGASCLQIYVPRRSVDGRNLHIKEKCGLFTASLVVWHW